MGSVPFSFLACFISVASYNYWLLRCRSAGKGAEEGRKYSFD